MAPKNRGKRVRIQSGHQARYIEKRSKRRSKSSQRKKVVTRSRMPKLGDPATRCRATVSELVYQFLEKASRRGVDRRRKHNATSQFRRQQRKHSRGRKRNLKSCRSCPYGHVSDDAVKPDYECIEKCIIDVLSFGTIMGFLEPVDKKGMMFRVASELNLFDKKKMDDKRMVESAMDEDYDDDGDYRITCIC